MMARTCRRVAVVLFILVSLLLPAFAFQNTPPSDTDASTFDENITVMMDDNGEPYAENQIIVAFKPGAKAEAKLTARQGEAAKLHRSLGSIDAEVWRMPPGLAKAGLERIRNNPNVLFAEYNYVVSAQAVPNDPGYSGQLYLPYMKTPSAWDYGYGTGNALVAVLDSGVSTGNDDLKGMIQGGYNFISMTSNYADDYGHGTQVASVIGARVNNGFGIAGIAGNNPILSVKVLNASGSGTYATMIQGIDYAVSQGASVINMSIGGRSASTSLKLAVDKAVAAGVVIVAAAGNEGSTALSYPAAYDNVIGVGAVDLKGVKMSFSNTGSGLTIMAGGSARVATTSNSFTSANGTSFSSPYVAGLVALMKDAKPASSPQDIFNAITVTALDLGTPGYDTSYGYGLVQMDKAVGTLIGLTPITNATTSITTATTTAVAATSSTYATTAATTSTTAEPIATTVPETIVLEPQTSIAIDISTFEGTLTKKITRYDHNFTAIASGTLTISTTYTGRTAPTVEFQGQVVAQPSQSFQIGAGSYTISVMGSGGSYTLIVQHPERIVSLDVPKGDLVIPYTFSPWYYVLVLLVILSIGVLAWKIIATKMQRH